MRNRDLTGRVVVITGASSGVGRATALAFARHGARLVLAARGDTALAEVAEECRRYGAAAAVVPTDVGVPADVEALARHAVDEFGGIDVWVQAAAVVVAAPIGEESVDELRRLIDTNVGGPLWGARAALGVFRRQGHGTLIDVGSLLGLLVNPVVPAYVMSKFAVRGLSLSLRQGVIGQPGIDVCLVEPGPIDTPLFERAANHTGRQLRAIPPAYAPERVAAAIVRCARRPHREVTVGVVARGMLGAHRIAPRLTEAVIAQVTARTIVRRTPASETAGALFDPWPSGRVHGPWRRGRLRRRLGEWYGVMRAAP